MRTSLLVSVAAIGLLASSSYVAAQGTGPAGGQGAPATKGDAPPRASQPASPGAPSQAQQKPDAGVPKSASPESKPTEPKAPSATKAPSEQGKPSAAETKPTREQPKSSSTETKPGKPGDADESKKEKASKEKASGAETKRTGTAPPAEKRTEISTTIKQQKVEEVTNVNFNISIGTRVPRTVRYHPLPPRVIEIYPEWRGYYFILVKGRYVILEPETYEIVYIIEG